MDILSIPIFWMVVAFVALVLVFFVIMGFKLPRSYYKSQEKRSEIRQQLREKEYEEKHPKPMMPDEDE